MSQLAPLSHLQQAVPPSGSYILLVDDHEPSLQQLEELVRRSGFRCVAAGSGSEALAWCDRSRPRVVVTDFGMPDLDGRALARRLRARHQDVPVILLSGHPFDDRSIAAMRRRFTAVLSKPVDIERLLRLLDPLMPRTPNRERDLRRS